MPDSPALEQAKLTWKWRAITITRGNQSRLGAVLLATLGKHTENPPWFGPSAVIDDNGNVFSNFVDRHNSDAAPAFIGTVEEVVSNFNGLADAINATDQEREEMFAGLRQWISKDARAMRESADTLRPTSH